MRTDRESNEVDGLLKALLADDDWHALNGSLKREALAVVGVTRRWRRLRNVLGQAACAAMLLVGTAWWWLGSSAPEGVPLAETSGQSMSAGLKGKLISEEEMLATFPAGSCVVAEINGEKTLVFFDAKQAEEGFAWSRE